MYGTWWHDKCSENYERCKVVRNEVRRAVGRAKSRLMTDGCRNWWRTSIQSKEMFCREVKKRERR